MTDINLKVTIPDNQMARVQAALRAHWGKVPDEGSEEEGAMRDMTGPELVEKLRQSIRRSIVDIVKRQEQDAAKKTAADGVEEVEAE